MKLVEYLLVVLCFVVSLTNPSLTLNTVFTLKGVLCSTDSSSSSVEMGMAVGVVSEWVVVRMDCRSAVRLSRASQISR